jgi:hypothetical protein
MSIVQLFSKLAYSKALTLTKSVVRLSFDRAEAEEKMY